MKTPHFTFIILVFCVSASFAQTIRRVDNNPGVVLGANMYATLQEAHNAASSGDIIYVQGSTEPYDFKVVCSKKLTWIGPGYFLSQNFPNSPDTRAALTYEWNFNPGSEGSAMYGFTGNGGTYLAVNASNIIISRNHEFAITMGDEFALSNLLISKNYNIRILNMVTPETVTGLNIVNNHITSIQLATGVSGTISNNTITGYIEARNFTLSNNILTQGNDPSLTNCTFNNNIDARALTGASGFGTTNGNLANVNSAQLFIGETGNSTDGQWKLKTGSVAIGAGFNGVDCGMYGGADPYILSGVPTVPTITLFTTSGTASSKKPLSVTISIKSNK